MDIKIGENKFKKLLFDYLNSINELKYAEEHRNYTDVANEVRVYFYPYYYEGDMETYLEFAFVYYNSPEAYEDVVGVTSPYESSQYPLIEMDTYFYKKIISLFGDTYAPKLIVEWLNDRYGLDAVSIEED